MRSTQNMRVAMERRKSSVETMDLDSPDLQEKLRSPHLKNELFDSMQWLIIVMKAFGLIHIDNSVGNVEGRPKRKLPASRVYQLCVIALLSANQARMCFIFVLAEGINPQLFMDMTFFCWMFLSLMDSVNMLKACSCKNKLLTAVSAWKKFNQKPSPVKMANYRKKCIIMAVASISGVPTNMVLVTYALLTTSLFDGALTPISRDHEYIIVIRAFYMIPHVYICSSFMLTTCLILLLGYVAHNELKEFNEQFRSCITPEGDFIGDLEEQRMRHQRICEFIEDSDASVSMAIGFSFLFCMMELLLVLYNLIWWHDLRIHPLMMFLVCFWCILVVSIIGLIIFFCAYVNHEVGDTSKPVLPRYVYNLFIILFFRLTVLPAMSTKFLFRIKPMHLNFKYIILYFSENNPNVRICESEQASEK